MRSVFFSLIDKSKAIPFDIYLLCLNEKEAEMLINLDDLFQAEKTTPRVTVDYILLLKCNLVP